MAWIESHQELLRHPKLIRLARILQVSKPTAIGHLHCLWWWAVDYAQDGDLSYLEAQEIADAVEWEGDPNELFDALVKSGFLDSGEDGHLTIHDWDDYAGRLVQKRQANAERMRVARATHVRSTNGARAGATVPNPTVPNPTIPDQTLMADEPPTAAEPPSFESPKNFQQWEELLKREANKVAVLTRAAFMLTTGEVPPSEAYGRMGNIAKAANNDHGFVLTKIWDCAKMKPAGDFLSYVQRALKPARAGPNRSRASPPETNTDYLSEYQQRRGHLPWEQRNGNDDHTGTDRG